MKKEIKCKCGNMAINFGHSLQTSSYKCECGNNILYSDVKEKVILNTK